MFPEPIETSIDLPPHLFHRCRRRVPDLLFDIAVAVLFPMRSILNHHQRPPDTRSQVAQHSHHLRAANRLAVMALTNPPVHTERSDCRELSRPSMRRARLETEARFIHEDDHCLAPPGLFLIRGQCSWSHCLNKTSSCSRTTRTGCWTFRPDFRNFSIR